MYDDPRRQLARYPIERLRSYPGTGVVELVPVSGWPCLVDAELAVRLGVGIVVEQETAGLAGVVGWRVDGEWLMRVEDWEIDGC